MTNEEPLNSHIAPLSSQGPTSADDCHGVFTTPRRRKLNRVGPRQAKYDAASAPCIGARLVHRRLQLQMTQAEVAADVSFQFKSGKHKNVERPLSRNAYCMYELGKIEPSLCTIVSLGHVLHVSPEWLAFGTGKKPNTNRQHHTETATSGQ